MAQYFTLFLLTTIMLPSPSRQAQDPRLLDRIFRDSAFRSYPKHCKTSVLYTVNLPPALRGVTADAVRFRAGSLRRHGASVKEFRFSPGVVVHPHVKRLVVIRQNLGNHSFVYSSYRNFSGFSLVTPVLGILIYDAANLYPSELEVSVKTMPITVNFSGMVDSCEGRRLLCVTFGLDGAVMLSNQTERDVCATWRQGHFGLVVESTQVCGSDDDSRTRVSVTKVATTAAVGGAFVAVLLGLVAVAMVNVKRKRSRMAEMERRAYEEEALQMSMVGHVRAPTAAVARTAPALENDFRHCL